MDQQIDWKWIFYNYFLNHYFFISSSRLSLSLATDLKYVLTSVLNFLTSMDSSPYLIILLKITGRRNVTIDIYVVFENFIRMLMNISFWLDITLTSFSNK